jgi:hypothetical protein
VCAKGLRDARALRDVARALVARGIDPRPHRRLDLSFPKVGAAKVKERLFFGRKKWTSFQRSIF